jgi:fumarate reductase iron-sulfur subunit
VAEDDRDRRRRRPGGRRQGPRDARSDAGCHELVGDDDGVFGCMSLLACHDVCPKNLPLATQIAFVRRAMVRQGFA